MVNEENPYAGQGPVLLDIGGDTGALLVTMPPETEGLEVEIRPAGATAARLSGGAEGHPHDHADHYADHEHAHGHGHSHTHTHASPYPHVGVVARAVPGGVHHSLVYPAVTAGDYELCPIPGDEVVLVATVAGGEVTEATWPTTA